MVSEKNSATSEFNRERICDEFAPRCQVPNGSHLRLSLSSPAFAISPSESESKVRANRKFLGAVLNNSLNVRHILRIPAVRPLDTLL